MAGLQFDPWAAPVMPGAAFGTMSPGEEGLQPQTFLDKAVAGVISSLASLPKRAIEGAAMYQPGSGEIPAQTIGPALETAMLMGGGGLVGGAEAGTVLGSGPARMRMVDSVDLYKELANQRRAQGLSVGKSAPGWDFKRPEPAKGSWDRLVAETKAKWEADKARAIAGYEDVAPRAIPSSPYMTPEDWAFIAKNGGLAVPGVPLAYQLMQGADEWTP